jgi:hypothetical protein
MSDYRESSIAGTSYTRGRSMYFENPLGSPPALLVREETVINLADRVITEHAGEIRKVVDDLTVEFPLRNPATNEIIEGQTMTYQDLYVGLFSLYWKLALDRDAEIAAQEIPE